MGNIRDRAKEILNEVPIQAEIRSDKEPDRFLRLTNTSQDTMMANWKTGGIMTACNGFVGWYAAKLGISGLASYFELQKSLVSVKKGYAWVPATASTRPKYGDILKHRAFHVDVSLGFDGDILVRAAAGQSNHPRPRTDVSGEFDVLKRVRGTSAYDFQKLEGWLDLELYFGPAPSTPSGPVPAWLPGWWKVMWRGQAYYYYFDRSYEVKWTQNQPSNTDQPIVAATDTGDVVVESSPDRVTITWRGSGSVEKFAKVAGNDKQLQGKWNDKETLTAVKM